MQNTWIFQLCIISAFSPKKNYQKAGNFAYLEDPGTTGYFSPHQSPEDSPFFGPLAAWLGPCGIDQKLGIELRCGALIGKGFQVSHSTELDALRRSMGTPADVGKPKLEWGQKVKQRSAGNWGMGWWDSLKSRNLEVFKGFECFQTTGVYTFGYPARMPVTNRMIRFLVGDPFTIKPSFSTGRTSQFIPNVCIGFSV